jgi:hypothetical protein
MCHAQVGIVMNNKPLLVLSEHFALAASMAIFSTVATLLAADLPTLGGDTIFVSLNRPSVGMSRRNVGVVVILQSFGKDGARPFIVPFLMAITAPHVLSLVLL